MGTVEFRNVSFKYPLSEKEALKEVSLKIDASEFVVVCGKSGCGKTTLLRQLKKNLMPYGRLEGEVLYDGENPSDTDDRKNAAEIGFVRQDPDNQIVTDKVWHELAFGLESLGLDNSTIKRRVAETASFFDIQTWFRKNTDELSGGQKQMVNLASVMVMQPKLLILDEPTAQLDPIAASEFLRTIHRINREIGTTVILSEHRLEEAFVMADRVVVMEEGKILCDDVPTKVGTYLSGEPRNDMFLGLPSVMKIFNEIEPSGESPLTMREGRIWLESFLKDRIIPETMQRELPPEIRRQEQGKDRRESKNDEQGHGKGTDKSNKEGRKSNKDRIYAIEAKDLWFRYSKKEQDVLRGTDLRVPKGQWLSILGGNGTGKSTLLKALCGVIKPSRGNVKTGGRISMLPQDPRTLFTEITAEEELQEALYDKNESDKEKAEKTEKMICLMELQEIRKMHPYDLSGGEQQRLALGKVLLTEPSIILLDEPTKGLDAFFKRTLAEIFMKLTEEGMTIVMVSHDMEFCAEYSYCCAMFFDGEVVSADVPEDFFSGNNFYTTVSNRIAGKWFPKAVTYQEVAGCVKAMM